jgi:hypothetical protein
LRVQNVLSRKRHVYFCASSFLSLACSFSFPCSYFLVSVSIYFTITFPLFFLNFVYFVFAFSFASLSLRFSLCFLLYLFPNIICLCFVSFLYWSMPVCPFSVLLHGRLLSAPEMCLRAKFMNIASVNKHRDSCL